jgi:hypothetical protein
MKNFFGILALSFILTLCFTLVSYAQDNPPITEADLVLFKDFNQAGMTAGQDPAKIEALITEIAASHNTTEEHLQYVVSKIAVILSIVANPSTKDSMLASLPPEYHPSDDEVKFISDNITKLY